jgi:hypothetical protein
VWPEGLGQFKKSTQSGREPATFRLVAQRVLRAFSPGVKRLGREVNHSPAASAEVKKMWIYAYTTPCLHGVVLN